MSGLRRARASALALGLTALLAAGTLPLLATPASAAQACFGRTATKVGSLRADTITGGSKGDVILGRKGNDLIVGGDGDDRICGGPGKDTIRAYDGFADRIDCGGGKDRVTADPLDRIADNCEHVTVVNSAPTALALSNSTVVTGTPRRTVVGTLSAHDSDPRDAVTYSFAKGPGSGANPSFVITGSTLRTDSVFSGAQTLSVRVRATDRYGASSVQAFTIHVVPPVVPPTPTPTPTPTPSEATADAFTITRGTGAAALDVLANDNGTDTVASVTQPAHGTVTIAPDGSDVEYTPTAGYCNVDAAASQGPDTFTYTLTGGTSATVAVTVQAEGGAPTWAVTKQFNNLAPTAITVPADSVQNTLQANRTIRLSAAGSTDPGSCVAGADSLGFSWRVDYPAVNGEYRTSGMSGWDDDTLVTLPQSLLNAPTDPGAKITLVLTSSVTGLQTTVVIQAIVTSSILTPTVFDQCQALPQGDEGCAISVAGPAPAPAAPTDITLSDATIAEDTPAGRLVGILNCAEADQTTGATYELVAGTGDDDNAKFTISGYALKLAGPLDFEAQETYSIRVRATNSHNQTFEKVLTITVTDVPD